MPRPDTWSDRARPGKLQHHSARGKMPRNAGDFTRGRVGGHVPGAALRIRGHGGDDGNEPRGGQRIHDTGVHLDDLAHVADVGSIRHEFFLGEEEVAVFAGEPHGVAAREQMESRV